MTALLLHFFTKGRNFALILPSEAIAFPRGYRFVSWAVGVVTVAMLSGCDRLLPSESGWEIYQNSRYGFEFPYPTGWIAEPSPDNQDGQAFRAPDQPDVEVAGWATQIPHASGAVAEEKLPEPEGILPDPIKENFVTEQGLSGELEVQIAAETSSLNLTLEHEGVIYRWQGRSPSQQFEDYYKFFNYVASHYRVLSATEP